MVDIQPQTVQDSTYDDGAPWLLAVDRKFNRSITVDLTKFTAEHKSPDGRFVLSGVALAEDDAGLWGPAGAGEEVAGHLFTPVQIIAGSTRSAAALLTHGAVLASAVPGGVGDDRPALIRYE